jgi:pyridoxine 5-phosphate synthase
MRPTKTSAAPRLSVNLNKVATLRNTRNSGVPSVVHCAQIALGAGAHGITLHPRPDERHIRSGDVVDVAQAMTGYPDAELNLECNPFYGVVDHARRVRPAQCTLVPDEATQATSDHGWDLRRDGSRLAPVVAELRALGCRVSLFLDADARAMSAARDLGADRVELYTEPYASAFARGAWEAELAAVADASATATALGMGVNAGHDLNRANLPPLVARLPGLLEVSIGHALVADALEFGLAETVRRYLVALAGVSSTPGALDLDPRTG